MVDAPGPVVPRNSRPYPGSVGSELTIATRVVIEARRLSLPYTVDLAVAGIGLAYQPLR